jgi:hypothetical protein
MATVALISAAVMCKRYSQIALLQQAEPLI